MSAALSTLVRFTVSSLLLAPAGCSVGGAKVWTEEKRQLDIPVNFARLEVRTDNGAVTATGADGPATIHVAANVRGGGANHESAEACLKAIVLTSETIGGAHRLGWKFAQQTERDWQGEVAFDVTMPRGIELEVAALNGGIKVEGIDAGCKLSTQNGGIEAKTGKGVLVAESQNGRVEAHTLAPTVTLASYNGAVEATLLAEGPLGGSVKTYNGSVRVALGAKAATDLACDTMNGSVNVKVLPEKQESRGGHVRGKVGAGGAELKVETYNGSIDVHPAKS